MSKATVKDGSAVFPANIFTPLIFARLGPEAADTNKHQCLRVVVDDHAGVATVQVDAQHPQAELLARDTGATRTETLCPTQRFTPRGRTLPGDHSCKLWPRSSVHAVRTHGAPASQPSLLRRGSGGACTTAPASLLAVPNNENKVGAARRASMLRPTCRPVNLSGCGYWLFGDLGVGVLLWDSWWYVCRCGFGVDCRCVC